MNQNSETESLTGGAPPPMPPPQPSAPTAQPASSSMPSDYQPQPASVTSGYGTIETPYVAPTYTWYEDYQRNTPQSRSLAAASMIFLSGGMSLAMSVGVGPITEYGTHAQYCWFIAVIIGALISASLVHKLTKRTFYFIASILVIVKGTIYIVFATENPLSWILLARYCDGIAFGLTIIPAIIAGSEQSVKKFRGRVLGVEQSSLSVGAMLLAIFSVSWETIAEVYRVIGIASLIYGLVALIYTFATTVESPIFYLRRNNETEALNALRQLQKPKTITNETYALLNENKMLLEEDLNRGITNNVCTSFIPMLKVTILRVLVSLSFSLPLTWGFLITSTLNNLGSEPNPFPYVFMRLLGVTISLLTIDSVGRRATGGVALLTGSILLLGIGTLFGDNTDPSVSSLHAAIAFLIFHQILAGVVAPASTTYLGEAFSPSVKPYFILISIVVENIIQIAVCSHATFDSTSNFAMILAALQFIYAMIYFFTVPETKQTTLREALDKFRGIGSYIRLEGV
ncbi:uncharacterized protein LOC129947074 [Eupeodes corollae]|uniref:uncharacterized protein LOC129947074 n=1 Tax=Eupeodes corollae TaxID=290404 RepID=UPI002492B74E|nr:uncharacterized protein LOC129947074 [Eupeodes corollae]